MLSAHWPLFGLRVTTPRLELQYPDDAICNALVDVAARGIHDPATMPFSIPWTDESPPMLQRHSLQYLWRERSEWTPDRWRLPMAVVLDGEVVGVQALQAD